MLFAGDGTPIEKLVALQRPGYGECALAAIAGFHCPGSPPDGEAAMAQSTARVLEQLT